MPVKNYRVALTKGQLTSLLSGKSVRTIREGPTVISIRLARDVDPMGGSFYRQYKQMRRKILNSRR